MTRAITVLVVASICGVAGATLAHRHEHGENVKVISARDIKEKLDGKETMSTVVEVTIEAGKEGVPHRHPGPAFGYVLEGEYEIGIDEEPTKIVKAGETFYEPSGCVHRVSRNPSKKTRTRLIAVLLHPRDKKDIATPVESK